MARLCFFKGCCSQFADSSTETDKGKSLQDRMRIAYGVSLVKGKANHPMEDYHVAKLVQLKGLELGLFGIFDGHLGDKVPQYLQKHLFNNILKEDEFWTHPDKAISKAYEKTDKAILSHNPELGRGGSTAVTAILIDGRKLWIANVGDSRGVLATGREVLQLTVDHEPSTERGKIETRGGFVSNMPGDVPRVNGQLAVSRAFGDKSLKSHLSSDPDIFSVDISSDTELLILASDGIWKVLDLNHYRARPHHFSNFFNKSYFLTASNFTQVISNQEAVDITRNFKDLHAAAKQLTSEAVRRDSKDDISCIVVRFKA